MKIQAFTCIFSQSLNYELYILNYALNEVVGQNGLAFLRKSHAG